eukprot:Clim_evm75s156 gene=Clim_evmTU75s156
MPDAGMGTGNRGDALLAVYQRLRDATVPFANSNGLKKIDQPSSKRITHIYNPLEYAWEPIKRYVQLYGSSKKQVVMVGMNPGPFGMAQTGIPFGDIPSVQNFMHIGDSPDRADFQVGKPSPEHPQRPIEGFSLGRREVSGTRLWGWAADLSEGSAERFFEHTYVHNFCPLVFMTSSGSNVTPDALPDKGYKSAVLKYCTDAITDLVRILEPHDIIAIGNWTHKTLSKIQFDREVRVVKILHPSPASPLANNWPYRATAQLQNLALLDCMGGSHLLKKYNVKEDDPGKKTITMPPRAAPNDSRKRKFEDTPKISEPTKSGPIRRSRRLAKGPPQ